MNLLQIFFYVGVGFLAGWYIPSPKLPKALRDRLGDKNQQNTEEYLIRQDNLLALEIAGKNVTARGSKPHQILTVSSALTEICYFFVCLGGDIVSEDTVFTNTIQKKIELYFKRNC